MESLKRRWSSPMMTAGVALALIVPAAAEAASTMPAVRTGGASVVRPQSAKLSGTVDPNGAQTTYFFEYGPTNDYGVRTPVGAAGDGGARAAVSADIAGLAPDTRYHYRLVARNRNGTRRGGDRSFRTFKQPLGVTLAANPNPVRFGSPTTLGGQLTGSDNAGRQVVLQSNPFPYLQGFQNVANPQVTDVNGLFAFPLLSVALNTQYRVQMPAKPKVVSPIVPVGVHIRVSTRVSAKRVRRGKRVRFSGVVRPARDNGTMAIQKLKDGIWVTVTGTLLRHRDAQSSRFTKRVRVVHGGRYRVFAGGPDSAFDSWVGRTIRIRTHR